MPTDRVIEPRAPGAVVLLRLAIAFVFITEGVQKFLDPELFGAGAFVKIGIPYPQILGPVVGGVECAAGALVLIGLFTRWAAFALLVDMLVAIAATKVPILLGYGFWRFAAPSGNTGFWPAAHEARLDLMLLFGCALLLSIGPGVISFDERD
ncbi:MAG TPA: DoxX family protein [Kofleriaceae bacterium]|nr:DoxX family protein [Kofleriaceae bacterium]